MSGAKQEKSRLARGVDAFSLAMLFGLLYVGKQLAPGLRGDAGVLGALGFLLLAGTLLSELIEVLGVPHLTGYLLAGILAGPYVLHLIDHDSVQRLEAVNTLAIALIALAGGAELRLRALKESLRSLVAATFFQTLLVLVGMAAIFYFVRPAFVRDMPPLAVFGVSLLWGCIAITRSPSALLAVLSQTRASGPVSRFSLAFILASDLVVVVVLAGVITIARPLVESGSHFSGAAISSLGHEILGSIALGTTLGLLLAAYVKLVGKQLLVVLVALGFGATEVLHYLSLEPLLTFMVAGFVVQNLSKQGEKFLHAIEATGGVVYVVFFAGAGAHLNVPLLREYWPLALILTGSRGVITYVAGRLGSRIANDEPMVKKWGFAALISQAGVALGIAQVIARSFPSFGPSFRDIALACIAINEMVGPILFKFALDRAKETKAPAPSLEEAEEVAS